MAESAVELDTRSQSGVFDVTVGDVSPDADTTLTNTGGKPVSALEVAEVAHLEQR